MAQQVKDPGLLQLWHRSQLWLGFDPWLRNFHMPQIGQKRRRERDSERKRDLPITLLFKLLWYQPDQGTALSLDHLCLCLDEDV